MLHNGAVALVAKKESKKWTERKKHAETQRQRGRGGKGRRRNRHRQRERHRETKNLERDLPRNARIAMKSFKKA